MPDLLKARTDDPQLHHLADVIAECGRRGHEMAESMLSFVRGSRKPSERIEIKGLFDAVALLLRSNVPDAVRPNCRCRTKAWWWMRTTPNCSRSC